MAVLESFRGTVKAEDCDHLGHMNLGRYMELCGDGVFFLQGMIGLDAADIASGRRLSFAAVHADAQFKSELRVGEVIRLTTGVLEIGTRSVTLQKRLYAGAEDRLSFDARFKSAFMSLETRRAVPIPDDVRAALERYRVEG
jgi:acyl-CoA thioester hydrolase